MGECVRGASDRGVKINRTREISLRKKKAKD